MVAGIDRSRGFTLIEMSMVLAVVGLVTAGGVSIGASRYRQEKIAITEARLDRIERALRTYSASSDSLPCPARADIPAIANDPASGQPTDCNAASVGVVDRTFIGGTATDRFRFGAVPTRVLNLADEDAFDGWGGRIVYAALVAGTTGIGLMADYDTALPQPLPIRDALGVTTLDDRAESTVGYALVSAGEDMAGGWDRTGNSRVCPSGHLDSDNCANWSATTLSPLRIAPPNTGDGTGHYDDRLRYASLSALSTYAPDTATPMVASGDDFSCALRADARISCWGEGGNGQLGNGLGTGSAIPVTGNRLRHATLLSAGSHHACALDRSGQIWCWGRGDEGQIGDGAGVDRWRPVRILLPEPATALALGDGHSCAVLASGAVSCWGRNGSGQLGNGNSSLSSVPATVSGLSGVVSLAAGKDHTCALQSSGDLYCWGRGDHGQLGLNSVASKRLPTKLPLGNARAVAAGSEHTCALYAPGVFCWGRNDAGQLGNVLSVDQLLPAAAVGTLGAVSIAAGGRNSCALTKTGSMWCWGANEHGQLATSDLLPLLLPTVFTSLSNLRQVSVGARHACAALASGGISCWGDDGARQTAGDGSTRSRPHSVNP